MSLMLTRSRESCFILILLEAFGMDNRLPCVPHSFIFYPKAYALIGVLSAVSPVGEAAEVLLIGDSISLEYWVSVQNGSSPADNVFHINENALTSSNGVAKINSWLDSPHYWDAPLGEVVAVPPDLGISSILTWDCMTSRDYLTNRVRQQQQFQTILTTSEQLLEL